MDCPICEKAALVMSERNGIEIDYCPKCRGVWLDRGELDKIIERAAAQPQSDDRRAPAQPQQAYSQAPAPQRDDRPRDDYRHGNDGYYRKKKRDSFLSDLFDF